MANVSKAILAVIHDYKNRATDTKPEGIFFRITFQRERKYFPTGIKILARQWDSQTQRIIFHPDAPMLNRQLEEQRVQMFEAIKEAENSPLGFSLRLLGRLVENKSSEEADLSFIEFARKRMYERGLASSTIRQHEAAIKALEESGIIVEFADLTPANIKRFDAWLRTAKGIEYQATLYGYHKRIKVYVNEAVQMDYLKENPYQKVKTPRGDHKKLKYLIQDEVDALLSLEIVDDPSLEKVRSLFTLQMYTGLAYSDMYNVDWTQAEKRKDGRYYIRQSRLKTNEEYYLLLLPPAVAVLERFKWQLPTISNQKYNDYLKGLGLACGIKKPLTSHVARHTFATTITLANHVPIEIVAKMMGHSDIKTTQRYAKVLAEDVIDAFIGLEDKLK